MIQDVSEYVFFKLRVEATAKALYQDFGENAAYCFLKSQADKLGLFWNEAFENYFKTVIND